MLNHDLLLKNNELCLVGHAAGHSELHEGGLYVRDTRFLNVCDLAFAGLPLSDLELQSPAPDKLIITATNATFKQVEMIAPAHTMLFRIDVSLTTVMALSLTVKNFGQLPISERLDVSIGTDFRDMFDIRGVTPRMRPVLQPPAVSCHAVSLAATSADAAVISTQVTAPDASDISLLACSDGESGVTLHHAIALEPGEQTSVTISIAPEPVGKPLLPVASYTEESGFVQRLIVASPSVGFNTFAMRCDADLVLLQTTFPDGNIPAAGIPWFIAPFGRDSLIVALQTMQFYPVRSANTLRLLATLQGTKLDPFREEQPGKILHEMRYGGMARTGQIPHTPYYGSIDATPLFVMTVARHYLWHQDTALYEALLDNVHRAFEWMETSGDLDGDGLLEYSGTQLDAAHISQQGWKDSGDSLNFADGSSVTGPIALVEVQGYAFAAYAWMAEAARLHGDDAWADEIEAKAKGIRQTVEERFWLEDQHFYAQALDGQKQPVDAISSNPGHLLFCGLPIQERADGIARRFSAPDMNAGWGIRTLSSEMATYNPMSYHNGSIWPHDTSLAMAGLRDYGHIDLSRNLAMAIAALSSGDPRRRIAELYCGFPNEHNGLGPVNYPVSCIPQAWAAGSGLLAVATLLGIGIDPVSGALTADPHLPPGWEYLDVDGVCIGSRMFDVRARRVDNLWAVAIRETSGS